MDNLRFQSTEEQSVWHFRDNQKRADKYFLDTPIEELVKKNDMSLVHATSSYLNKQARIYSGL